MTLKDLEIAFGESEERASSMAAELNTIRSDLQLLRDENVGIRSLLEKLYLRLQALETIDRCSNMDKTETGICNSSSCDDQYQYVTVGGRLDDLCLYMKTQERADIPFKWEMVKLPSNYEKALEIIDKNLMYWPDLFIRKAKFRLTKMNQMKLRMRRLALKTSLAKTKKRKREVERKKKEAELELDKIIGDELLERLKNGALEDYHRIPAPHYELDPHYELSHNDRQEDREDGGREYVFKDKKVDINNLDEDGMDMGDKYTKKTRARVTRSPIKLKKNKERVIVES